ncbi:HD domain-containing protein [Clostridium sp. LIBA-8841]|uniref:HD domain-containing protein n=1 Tax=Clostridium sp. LIBA-8841 TaxID=2987530 RepID=UPI002AC64904|nr:HD domain-containing protein [Clostridium sp. LIBA-8841]MDZ5255314.1 HDIG domain-containing protein [Clostridium sp. LIBA-8841]
MTYRIKQFFWAISANFKELDYAYVECFLTEYELHLFKKLKKGEQLHCIKVSRDCVRLARAKGINSDIQLRKVSKLGLLHDIGKLYYPLNVMTKSFLILGKRLSNNEIRKFQNIKAIYIYYNHGDKAFNYLRENDYDPDFIEAIKGHHSMKSGNNILLDILKEADDMN